MHYLIALNITLRVWEYRNDNKKSWITLEQLNEHTRVVIYQALISFQTCAFYQPYYRKLIISRFFSFS